jgi:hypothetical protein
VQTVYNMTWDHKKGIRDQFFFEFRFNDMIFAKGAHEPHSQEKVFAPKRDRTTNFDGVRSTFQVTLPLEIPTTFKAFPFEILEATTTLELSSCTVKGGDGFLTLYRPRLLIDMRDRRRNVAMQEIEWSIEQEKNNGLLALMNKLWPIKKNDKKTLYQEREALMDQLDHTKQFDFITPYPEVEYHYETGKNDYCTRMSIKFHTVRGGFKKFLEIILPMILVGIINTINVWNDNNNEVKIVDHLGVSSALTLTVVFLLPNVIVPTARQNLVSFDGMYVLVVFIALMLSSFPQPFSEEVNFPKNLQWAGAYLFWGCFVSPAINCIRFAIKLRTVNLTIKKTFGSDESNNPYLKDATSEEFETFETDQKMRDANQDNPRFYENSFATVASFICHANLEQYGYKVSQKVNKKKTILSYVEKETRQKTTTAAEEEFAHPAPLSELAVNENEEPLEMEADGSRADSDQQPSETANADLQHRFDLVLSAMRAHPTDAVVQRDGCESLLDLAYNIRNMPIAARDGAGAVIATMRAHASDAGVQQSGCFLLNILAENDNNQVTIAAGGGIDAVIAAMQTHASNANIQYNGCEALSSLSDNDNNKVTIAAGGGIDAVITAMQTHADYTEVKNFGGEVLRRLGHQPSMTTIK